MSEQGKGSMLLPLGIGAGLVLLYLGMKKKESAQPPPATDPAALLPEVKEGSSSVPQIEPDPAPSYAQVSKITDPDDASDAADGEDAKPEDEEEGPEDTQTASSPEGQDDEDEDGPSPQGSSNFITTQPSVTATARQLRPASARPYVPAAKNVPVNSRNMTDARFMARQVVKPGQQLTSAKRKVVDFARQKLRFKRQPRPNQQLAVPTVVTPNNTALPAQSPFVNITSNTAVRPPASTVRQATIFPLRFGITSPYVKEVQRKLGVSATGYFGTMTRTAIQKRFRVSEISEALYKQIITGKKPVALSRKPVATIKTKKQIIRKAGKVKYR